MASQLVVLRREYGRRQVRVEWVLAQTPVVASMSSQKREPSAPSDAVMRRARSQPWIPAARGGEPHSSRERRALGRV